jgi:hypothetical protein
MLRCQLIWPRLHTWSENQNLFNLNCPIELHCLFIHPSTDSWFVLDLRNDEIHYNFFSELNCRGLCSINSWTSSVKWRCSSFWLLGANQPAEALCPCIKVLCKVLHWYLDCFLAPTLPALSHTLSFSDILLGVVQVYHGPSSSYLSSLKKSNISQTSFPPNRLSFSLCIFQYYLGGNIQGANCHEIQEMKGPLQLAVTTVTRFLETPPISAMHAKRGQVVQR